MPPPEFGYGPVNYARPGHIDPFAAFDNRIRYNDMIRQQMISQYQQGTVQPTSMTLAMQRHVAMDPRFQYGVPGGQDPRHYQRQAELRRMGVGTAIAKTAMDIGAWEAGAGIAGMAGMGMLGGIAFPAALGAAALYMPMRGINNAMQRQQFMHSMAADIEQYRDQLGFRGGLSYNQATNLAGRMQRNMYQGGFFNTEQQSKIHKIALSNNMISARGGRASGTLRQYERNFEELRETTEEVVKLMQTTIEGGMSVIKELQQTGFGGMRQVRHQIRQAKAFGGITGLGAQNMMQIGAAGARAVQGTPWAANVGASMYQTGAAQASFIARSDPAGAYAVQRAGGVAAAGGAIARAQMNVLSSGMGTKAVAYAMRPDGTVDEDRMNRLMSGKVGAYEMVVGASQRGYAMGISGRVQFERYKEDMLNQMSDVGRTQMVNRVFQAWGSGRYGDVNAKAWVFAGQFTNNQREQRLMYESLLRPKGLGEQFAGMQAARATLNQSQIQRPLGPIGSSIAGANAAVGGFFNRFGEDVVYQSGRAMTGMGNMLLDIKKGASGMMEKALQVTGIYDEYGGVNRATYADPATAVRNMYSVGISASQAGIDRLAQMSPGAVQRLRNVKQVKVGVDFGTLMRTKDPTEVAYAYQQLGTALYSGTAGDIYKNDKITRVLGAAPGSELYGQLKSQPIGTINALLSTMNQYRRSVSKQYEDSTTEWDRISARLPIESRKRINDMLLNAKQIYRATGDAQMQFNIGGRKIQGIPAGTAGDLVAKRAKAEVERERSELVGPTFNQLQVDMEPYRKARREAGYSALGFKMEMGYTTRKGIRSETGEMRETAETKKRKAILRKFLGPGFRMDTPERQLEVIEEIERLRVTPGEAAKKKMAGILPIFTDNPAHNVTSYFNTEGEGTWQDRIKEWRTKRNQEQEAEALKIRDGRAYRMIDTLEQRLGYEVTDKQKQFLTQLVAGDLSKAQIKRATSPLRGGGEMLSMLSAYTETTPDVVKAKIESGELPGWIEGVSGVWAKRGEDSLAGAREELKQWRVREAQLRQTNDGFIKEGKKEYRAADIAKGLTEAEFKLKDLETRVEYPTTSRDRTSYTSVQPPILNYWNNKWTL